MNEELSSSEKLSIAFSAIGKALQPFVRAMQECAKVLVNMWRNLARWLRYMRTHGNRYERRMAWKLLHPARKRPLKLRVMIQSAKRG